MARGKIQIKKIENPTNRQVTYSKRRNGLFKKANELTVLCDARVSIIMVSGTGKLHDYISPSLTTKEFYDYYQQSVGVDLWSSQYEEMQEKLQKLKDVNMNLCTAIRQRMGECINEMEFEELYGLEQEMEIAVRAVRERKMKVLSNQIETYKKKKRNLEEINRNLLHEFDPREEDPPYGYVDNGVDYEPVIGFSHGAPPRLIALRLPPNHHYHHHHPHHHHHHHPHHHQSIQSGGTAASDLTTYALLD